LLIEEKKGISYRRGVGQVPSEIWERQNPTQVDIVLG